MENFSFKKTLKVAFESSLYIIKLIVPLYIVADLMLYFKILDHFSFIFEPLTKAIHLPAETAVGIAAGMIFNLYAAIAFLAPLNLTPMQWTVIAVFLGIAHSLMVESAIMKKIGIPIFFSIVVRIIVGFIGALLVPFFHIEKVAHETQTFSTKTYSSVLEVLQSSILKSFNLSIKIIILITVIIFFMNFLKSLSFINRYQKKVNTSFSIFTGLFLGITYGAGILISESKSGNLTKKDLIFVGVFLIICHSVIEDPLLFVLFGANFWVIVLIRLLLAIAVSFGMVKLYDKFTHQSPTINS